MTKDTIEAIGVERAKTKISDAQVLLYVVDPKTMTIEDIKTEVKALKHQNPMVLLNKADHTIQTNSTSNAKGW